MGSIRELSKAQLQYVQFSFLMKYFNSVDAINKCILCNTGLYCTDWLCLCSVSDHTPFLWHRWFSPPVNLEFLTYYWVQSAPCLQRTSVTQWAPVWMAQKGCLLPAQACSSSTSIRTMDNVSNPTHTARISVICVWIGFVISRSLSAPRFSIVLCLSCSVLYSNTEQTSVYLTRSSPVSLFQSIQYSSRTIYLCWHYLTDAVRSVYSKTPPISW